MRGLVRQLDVWAKPKRQWWVQHGSEKFFQLSILPVLPILTILNPSQSVTVSKLNALCKESQRRWQTPSVPPQPSSTRLNSFGLSLHGFLLRKFLVTSIAVRGVILLACSPSNSQKWRSINRNPLLKIYSWWWLQPGWGSIPSRHMHVDM